MARGYAIPGAARVYFGGWPDVRIVDFMINATREAYQKLDQYLAAVRGEIEMDERGRRAAVHVAIGDLTRNTPVEALPEYGPDGSSTPDLEGARVMLECILANGDPALEDERRGYADCYGFRYIDPVTVQMI